MRATGGQRLRVLLVLCLLAALAFTAPVSFETAGADDHTAMMDMTAPCAASDGLAGDCASMSHHCAACLVAVVAPAASQPTPALHRSAPRLRVSDGQALNRPNVPHGPPRPV